ncbi:mevalonate kinase ['Osedax' symbiont bacterium Rs2_46_30_T18]|nr:mevalonate kinase ['Osedax' symbiont bacterium Rs2_46_30_T18]
MAEVIRVTAPGSVMLMGEHAVVKGYWAIACALDKGIEVQLTPRADRVITIDSALCQYQSNLDQLINEAKLSFVLKAISLQLDKLEYGFDLVIKAEFSHTLGLGSSAAVTAATVKALSLHSGQNISLAEHLQLSLAVVRAVQGRGSGTDLAASIYGGVIAYKVDPCTVEVLNGLPEISLHYVGYKTKTPDVLAIVAQWEQQQPELYANIYQLMDQISIAAMRAVRAQNWSELGKLMNLYQGQLDSLGVNDLALSEMIYQLRAQSGVSGAKISGSGLGDCVISLGIDQPLENYQQIVIKVSAQGVISHEQ